MLPGIFSIITAMGFSHLVDSEPNLSATLVMVLYTVSNSRLKSSSSCLSRRQMREVPYNVLSGVRKGMLLFALVTV